MASWYVYRGGEAPLGPWTTEVVADAILAGTLAPETWVAAPGGQKWLRASEVPVIAQLIEARPTRRGGDAAPGVAPDAAATPEAPYYGGGDTLESPGNDRRRR